MIDAPPALCWFCGTATEARSHGLCAACHQAARRPRVIVCRDCGRAMPHRGGGLCGACYQRAGRLEVQRGA